MMNGGNGGTATWGKVVESADVMITKKTMETAVTDV
jgi:hypothetical protein